jgi:hypothetical protein
MYLDKARPALLHSGQINDSQAENLWEELPDSNFKAAMSEHMCVWCPAQC